MTDRLKNFGDKRQVGQTPANAAGRWQKGVSGNPSGRPKIAKAWEAATGKTTGQVTAEALKVVWEVFVEGPKPDHNGNHNDPDWRFCAQKVLEYSAGKPKEEIEHTFGEAKEPEIDWSLVPLDKRERLLKALDEIDQIAATGAADEETTH